MAAAASLSLEILTEARNKLIDILEEDPSTNKEEMEASELVMDPLWSHSSETYYTPMFRYETPRGIRYLQISFKRTGPTEVDTDNPTDNVYDRTEEIKKKMSYDKGAN